MSITRMRKNMQSWFRPFMFLLAIALVISIVFMMAGGSQFEQEQNKTGVLAKVNRQKIDWKSFELRYEAKVEEISREHLPSAFEKAQMRGQMFDQEVDQVLLTQAAKQEGVKVSRSELNKKIDEIIKGEIDRQKGEKSDKAFEATLKKNGLTLAKYKAEMRKQINTDMLHQQLINEKLMEKLKNSIKSSDKDILASFDEVVFKQITVSTEKRTEVQAKQRAKEITEKLKKGSDFAALAKELSDDPYKAAGGERGYPMRRTYMEKELADIVFGLKAGETSEPVKTAQGFVIVRLQERKNNPPADFKDPEKKKTYKESYLAQEQYKVQSEFFENIRKNAKIQVNDPELKGFMLIKEMSSAMGPSRVAEIKTLAEKAIKEYGKAIEMFNGNTEVAARSYATIAYLYDGMRKPGFFSPTKEEQTKYQAEAKRALQNALEYSESNDLRLMLSQINIEEGEHDKALEHLQIVSENVYDDTDKATHEELLSRYEKIGGSRVAGLIANERKWLADYDKRMKDQPSAGGMNIPIQMNP